MAGKVFYCEPNKNKGSASSEPRKRKTCYPASARKFLPWEKCRFSGTFIDEAHIARTPGRMFVGFSAMMGASAARILATATPLQHTPKVSRTAFLISYMHGAELTPAYAQDTANLGRIVQLQGFLGPDGDDDDKRLLNALTRTNRELKGLASMPGANQGRILRGQDPTSTREHQLFVQAGQEYVAHAVAGWENRIIRRSNNSVSWDGKTPITQGVPALTVIDAYVQIPPQELQEMDAAVARLEEK